MVALLFIFDCCSGLCAGLGLAKPGKTVPIVEEWKAPEKRKILIENINAVLAFVLFCP